MTPNELARLVEECEALQRTVHDLNVQARSVEQQLAALSVNCVRASGGDDHTSAEGMASIVDSIIPAIREAVRQELKTTRPSESTIPSIREAIRQELKASGPLDEAWYEPAEVEALSCGKVRADTLRKWLRWGQIDGESDGRQIRLYQSTVEELRKNKWRPLREPDPARCPQSRRQSMSSR